MRLGDVVRDKISGFTGVATCRLEYLNGCVRWQVTTRTLHDAKPIDGQYFDGEQLEVVQGEENVGFTPRERELAAGATGGDRPNPAPRKR
jgi:hypothetical protein